MPIKEIRKAEEPLSPKRLQEVEARFQIKLPEEYREFLLKFNGGHPDPCYFEYQSKQKCYFDSDVAWFLAIYDGEYCNFETTFDLMKLHSKRMPDRLVPIADDSGGNTICISVAGDDYGSVYFWDHEGETMDDSGPTERNVFLIARSFGEFIDGLHELRLPEN